MLQASLHNPLQEMPHLSKEASLLRDQLKVIGLAVISADGYIAKDSQQHTKEWVCSEDFQMLQNQLTNHPGLCVMGRKTHELYPVPEGSNRKRLIFSSQTRYAFDDQFINPSIVDKHRLLNSLVEKSKPFSGRIYVLGGAGVYNLFLRDIGYDEFKLTIEHSVCFESGIKLFEKCPAIPDCISGKTKGREVALNYSGTQQIIFSSTLQ